MAQLDDLELDEAFVKAIAKDPQAAIVIEMRYLRRDVSDLNNKVDGIQVKQCPCTTVIELGKSVATIQGQDQGKDKSGSNTVAWAAIAVAVVAIIVTVI
jgi:hypothetical protein